MPDSSIQITAGVGTPVDTVTAPSGDHRQLVIPSERGGFTGRFTTLIIPGRAVTNHKLAAIHNASGSTIRAEVHSVNVDVYQTVVKAITVPPPLVRLSRFTTLPTGGNSGTAAAEDSSKTGSGSVTLWQDASAHRTSSASALTVTPAGGITQEFAARWITGAGYEPADRMEFLANGSVVLAALEGLVVELISPAGTSEPVTDMFVVSMRWEEYTP